MLKKLIIMCVVVTVVSMITTAVLVSAIIPSYATVYDTFENAEGNQALSGWSTTGSKTVITEGTNSYLKLQNATATQYVDFNRSFTAQSGKVRIDFYLKQTDDTKFKVFRIYDSNSAQIGEIAYFSKELILKDASNSGAISIAQNLNFLDWIDVHIEIDTTTDKYCAWVGKRPFNITYYGLYTSAGNVQNVANFNAVIQNTDAGIYLDNLFIFNPSGLDYSFSEIKTTINGNIVNKLYDNETLKAQVNVTTSLSITEPVCLVIALYNSKGKIEQLTIAKQDLSNPGQEYIVEANMLLKSNMQGYNAKIFLWKNVKGIQPLCVKTLTGDASTVIMSYNLINNSDWSADANSFETPVILNGVSNLKVKNITNPAIYWNRSETNFSQLDLSNATNIRLRLKTNITTSGTLKYVTDKEYSMPVAFNNNGEFNTYNISMLSKPGWSGTLNSLKLIFNSTTIGEEIQFDYIAIMKNNIRPINTIFPKINSGQLEYYVSNSGNDLTGNGSIDEPFATIEKARDTVRTINGNMTQDIVVNIRNGKYILNSPVAFDERDSGSNGYRITYRSYPGENAVISGGKEVNGWQAVQVGGKTLWKATVDGDINNIRQFYVNSERKKRSQIATPIFAKGIYWDAQNNPAGIIISTNDVPQTIAHPEDLEIVIPGVEWKTFILHISSITTDGNGDKVLLFKQGDGFINTQVQTAADKTISKFGYNAHQIIIENSLELLDTPGEWFFDKRTREIYYMPELSDNIQSFKAVIPKVEKLIDVNPSTAYKSVANLTFSDLIFEYTAWNYYSDNKRNGEQANDLGDGYTKTYDGEKSVDEKIAIVPAGLQFNFADSIWFKNNILRHMGAVGIGMYQGVNNSQFVGNLIYDIADGAITAGNPKQAMLDKEYEVICNNVSINNNLIYNIGFENRSAPAIQAYFVDSFEIAYNELFNLPYSGICVGWGWGVPGKTMGTKNKIKNNYIHDFQLVCADGGGIYTLGAQPNFEITGNYIRNSSENFGGIYNDEGSRYFNINANVIQDVSVSYLNNTTPFLKSLKLISASGNYSNVGTTNGIDNGLEQTVAKPVMYNKNSPPNDVTAIINGAGLQAEWKTKLFAKITDTRYYNTLSVQLNIPDGYATNADNEITNLEATVKENGIVITEGIYYKWSVDSYTNGGVTETSNINRRCTVFNDTSKATKIQFIDPGTYKISVYIFNGFNSLVKTVSVQVSESIIKQQYANVALNKAATASSIYGAGCLASNAVDGKDSTEWASANINKPDWLIIDLNQTRIIKLIELKTRENIDVNTLRNEFEIQLSNSISFDDYIVVGKVEETPLPFQSTYKIFLSETITYRYIRYIRTSTSHSAFPELRVYGQ